MQQEETDRLIKKVIAGEATPEEQEQLEKAFQQQGVGEAQPNEALAQWQPSPQQSARMLQQVLAQVPDAAPVRQLYPLQWISGIAAACIGLIILIALYTHRPQTTNGGTAVLARVITNTAAAAKEVVLPDSTHVWLHQHAALIWTPDDFTTNRKIELHGEAYFEVAQDAQHPFRIYNDSLETTVLGTSFDIREDTRQHTVTVALLTGKVALHAGNGATTTLQPGQAAVYHAQNRQLSTLPVPWYTLAWKTEQLDCTDKPLQQVIDYLQQHYGIAVYTPRAVEGLTFSGTLSLKEPLPVVLNRLLFVYGLQQKNTGDTIIIY